jgi:acetyl esterase
MAPNVQLERAAKEFGKATADPHYLFDFAPENGQSSLAGELPVEIEDRTVEGGASDYVSVRILRPRKAAAPLPVIVYIHGAGWVFGSAHTHDRLLHELAVAAQAAVVAPNYSLGPEAKYPAAIEENYAVVRWVAEKGLVHGLDPERLAVAGDSVGANLAPAVALMTKERGGGPVIQRQVLFYPVTGASYDTVFYHDGFATGFFLRRDAVIWFWDQYTTMQWESITASPLRACIGQLRELPPALIITGEADVGRDEGATYANTLREAGEHVTCARLQGIIHDFVMLYALAGTAAASGAVALATTWLREEFARRR